MKGSISFMKKTNIISKEEAYAKLMASFNTPRSRRALLKGAATATGIAVAGAGALSALPAHAMVQGSGVAAGQAVNMGLLSSSHATTDSIVTILTVARTAEQLAVTFYTNGINNASQLGISGANLDYRKGARKPCVFRPGMNGSSLFGAGAGWE
jgi:hypothetical protein